jgi:hypothetical protein
MDRKKSPTHPRGSSAEKSRGDRENPGAAGCPIGMRSIAGGLRYVLGNHNCLVNWRFLTGHVIVIATRVYLRSRYHVKTLTGDLHRSKVNPGYTTQEKRPRIHSRFRYVGLYAGEKEAWPKKGKPR